MRGGLDSVLLSKPAVRGRSEKTWFESCCRDTGKRVSEDVRRDNILNHLSHHDATTAG